ncbi:MAG: Asp-tRNA(Asn)/Glu-tRNA(Gln) amidotransferase subunit GatC [Cyanobacteria bacterium P01_F01_bin.33]
MIDREQVRHVAHLARLDLTPEEEEQLTGQLVDILTYVEQLSELDTADVEPTYHAVKMDATFRPDQLQTWDNREELLDGAPTREGDFIRVPRLMETAE